MPFNRGEYGYSTLLLEIGPRFNLQSNLAPPPPPVWLDLLVYRTFRHDDHYRERMRYACAMFSGGVPTTIIHFGGLYLDDMSAAKLLVLLFSCIGVGQGKLVDLIYAAPV